MRGNQIVAVLFLTLLLTPTFARRKKNLNFEVGKEQILVIYQKESNGNCAQGEFFMTTCEDGANCIVPKEIAPENVNENAETDISEGEHLEENYVPQKEMEEYPIVGGPDSLPPADLLMEEPEQIVELTEPVMKEEDNYDDYLTGGPGSLPPEPSFEEFLNSMPESQNEVVDVEPDNEIVADHMVGGPDSLPPVDLLIDESAKSPETVQADMQEEHTTEEQIVGGESPLPSEEVFYDPENQVIEGPKIDSNADYEQYMLGDDIASLPPEYQNFGDEDQNEEAPQPDLTEEEDYELNMPGGPDSLPPEYEENAENQVDDNMNTESQQEENAEENVVGGESSLPTEEVTYGPEVQPDLAEQEDNEMNMPGGPDSLPPEYEEHIEQGKTLEELEKEYEEMMTGGPGSLPPEEFSQEDQVEETPEIDVGNQVEYEMNMPGGPDSLPPEYEESNAENNVEDNMNTEFQEEEKPEEHIVGGEDSLPPTDILFPEENHADETIISNNVNEQVPEEFIVGGEGSLPPEDFVSQKIEEHVDELAHETLTGSLESNSNTQTAEQTIDTAPISNADDFLSETKEAVVADEDTAEFSAEQGAETTEAKVETILASRYLLNPGEVLQEGEKLVSGNGLYQLVMQNDGNLVLYKVYQGYDPIVFWASNTVNKGTAPRRLVYQGDNNLVIYDANNGVLFTANTFGQAPGTFILQDDGNAVIYNGEKKASWATGTNQPTWIMRSEQDPVNILKQGQTITIGQSISSLDGRYKCIVQADGNFVMYKNGNNAPWATGTSSNIRPFFLTLQGDGNLVLYDAKNRALWASGTNGKGASPRQLIMQDDGNLVLYDAQSKPLWATGQK